jgi:ankyrin repeat protein
MAHFTLHYLRRCPENTSELRSSCFVTVRKLIFGDYNERTPLHTAITNISRVDAVLTETMSFLLKHGADVNSRDDDLSTPLHLAALSDEFEAAQFLLEHGADIDARNSEGKTPLHLLFETKYGEFNWDHYQDPSFVGLFLEHGANLNAQDQHGNTPLYSAMNEELWAAVRFLLENGAKPQIDIETKDGSSALLLLLLKDRHFLTGGS